MTLAQKIEIKAMHRACKVASIQTVGVLFDAFLASVEKHFGQDVAEAFDSDCLASDSIVRDLEVVIAETAEMNAV